MSMISNQSYKLLSARSVLLRYDKILVKRSSVIGSFILPSTTSFNLGLSLKDLKYGIQRYFKGFTNKSGQIIVASKANITVLELDGTCDMIIKKNLLFSTTEFKNSTRLSGKGIIGVEKTGMSIISLTPDTKLEIQKRFLVGWDAILNVKQIDEFENKDYSRKMDLKPLFQRMLNNTLNFVGNNSRLGWWIVKNRILDLGVVELKGPGRVLIAK